MTDSEALQMVRWWWEKGVHLLNTTGDRGCRPTLEPNKFGWSVILRGAAHGANCFDGKTLGEAVVRAMPAFERSVE